MGVVAFAAVLVLALMAVPQLRRRRYDLFQSLHAALALLFVSLCALHDLPILLFALPGLASWYLCSTVDAGSGCERSAVTRQLRATARLLPGTGSWVELSISGVGSDSRPPGGRGHWVSLRAPTILGREWHPFSVAGWGAEASSLSVIVSTRQGDWSQRLGQQSKSGLIPFEVEIQGPYCTGGAWSLAGGSEKSGDRLLLLAGGTGVTGWIPALQARSEGMAYRLVWCVQSLADYSALAERLPLAASDDEQVIVYVTRDGGTASDEGHASPVMICTQPEQLSAAAASESGADPKLAALPFSVFAGLVAGYWGWMNHRPAAGVVYDDGWVGLAHYTATRRCVPILAIVAVAVATAAVVRRVARHLRNEGSRQAPAHNEAAKEEDSGRPRQAAMHQMRHGRPDLAALVAESAADVRDGGCLTVVACGPTGLLRTARAATEVAASRAECRRAIRFVGADPNW